MNILKNQQKIDKNILNYKNTLTKMDTIIPSKILKKNKDSLILEYSHQKSLEYFSEIMDKKNLFLFEYRKHNGNSIITDNIPKKLYKLYLNHFFNFIKKNNIKIVKGRVLYYKYETIFIAVNGIIVAIPKEKLTYRYKKLYNYKKWNKGCSFYKLIQLSFFCENIIKHNSEISLNISRKKFLKLLKKKKNATI